MPLVPLVVVSSSLPGSVRPLMALLQPMQETFTEWCPITERRVLSYLVRHAAVLGGSVQPGERWNHETLFFPPSRERPETRAIEGFPSPGDPMLFVANEPPMWQLMLAHNWQRYCDRLPTGPTHRFYVEPSERWMPEAMALSGLPHRVLYVARDPRSELAELWHQCRLTGVLPEPLTPVDTPLSFAEREANWRFRERLGKCAQAKAHGNELQLCIRYEDLLAQPAEAWQRVRRWLQLPERPAPTPTPTGHEWPPARWQPLMPRGVDAVLRKRMPTQLEALDYAF